MLNFTEHMKRIIELAEQSLVHVQAEKFDSARDDLNSISLFAKEAMQQLDDMSLIASQGTEHPRAGD
ncbi:unnamed protein product [marine sediment metagenome]|uniref:Uncharacterized protein n=1 Tax=marine sediment metagenome TaxID=412755 RepID=X1RYI6_9ZZZZ